jgi:serine/threonine protein phosphatase PrpC
MCDVLVKFYREPEQYPASYESIKQLMMEANREILNWGFMPGTDRPLGICAGTLVWLYKEIMHVFHAGDTIALLVRDGVFEQLTALHELDGSIYRYFGFGENLKIDVSRHEIEESDRILLMSDGVTKAMIPAEINALSEKYQDKAVAVREIVNRSRNKGSQDDITAMVIEIEFEI